MKKNQLKVWMLTAILLVCLPFAAQAVVWNGFTVTSSGEYELDTTGEIPSLYAKKGDTITVTANYTAESSNVESISWYFYNWDTNEQETLDCTESTYTFTFVDEGNLIFFARDSEQNIVADKNMYVNELRVNPVPDPDLPVVIFDVETSHPVVDDVLTVTEGDIVTIDTNATISEPGEEIGFFWCFDTLDENGGVIYEDVQDGVGEVFTFTATMDLNGKKLYAWGYAKSGASSLGEENWLYYLLKVLPKSSGSAEQYKVDVEEGLTADSLSDELKADPNLNTPEKVEADITIKVLVEARSEGLEVVEEQTAVYDVTLMYSEDGGITYKEATRENWPESGRLTVTLPYPEGTGMNTHKFVVAHMFTESASGHKAGDIEYPAVTNTASGIRFEVTGLSPIAVAWEENAASEGAPGTSVPATGDSAMPGVWMLCMLAAAAGCVIIAGKRRQNG